MAFETKNLKVFKKFVLPKNQIEKECVTELEESIDKVLSVSCSVAPLVVDVVDGEISYSATISTCVIFATSQMSIGTANSTCEFTGKIQNGDIASSDKAILSLSVKDHSVSVENDKVIVGVTIEESAEVFAERDVVTVESSDDDVCTKNSETSIKRLVCTTKKECSTEDEFVARGNVKKIIFLEPIVSVKGIESQNGFVAVSGETLTKIMYLTTEDKFETNYVSCPFKEEIEMENCDANSIVECQAIPVFKDCVSEVLESDKGTKISVKTAFVLNAFACGEEEVSLLEDLFSTTSEIQMTSESFEMSKLCRSEMIDSKIDGSLSLGEEKPRVDKILFCSGGEILVTNSYVSNGDLFVEGIAKTTVVYLNDDEGTLNSVEIEIPFAINDKTTASEEASVCVDGVIYDCDVVAKKGRELFFDGKVKINARLCEKEISATIVGAQRGEVFAERDYTMQYIYGKAGESLWEIAKRNKVSESQLVAQNADAIFPLIQDTGFVLFYQKTL